MLVGQVETKWHKIFFLIFYPNHIVLMPYDNNQGQTRDNQRKEPIVARQDKMKGREGKEGDESNDRNRYTGKGNHAGQEQNGQENSQ